MGAETGERKAGGSVKTHFLTDAHAHIKTKEEALERIKNNIPTMVCGTEPEDAEWVKKLCELPGADNILIPVFGLHPWYSDSWTLEKMKPYLEQSRIVGEIGMDSLWCQVPLDVQEKVFKQQLRMAAEMKKPVVLHTKAQEREILNLICSYENTYLVHWYSADHDLEGYLEQDCYFSIGPDVVWNPAVQRVARLVPENRILLETDGMGAVVWAWQEGKQGKRPQTVLDSLRQTAETAAKLRKMEAEALIRKSEENFFHFVLG